MSQPTQLPARKRFSIPGAVFVIGLLIAYALVQPWLNQQFGWQLPNLQALWEQAGPVDPSVAKQGRVDTAANPDTASKAEQADELLYDVLRQTDRDHYVSIAGLRYTSGSAEGHRLKHLERHLTDIPSRPGKHGVFSGEMKQVLQWIDEAFERGKRGTAGTHRRDEDNATVYEVTFDQPIGYIGGSGGVRDGHPPARRLRLVVDGNRFITAFPF